MIKLLVVDGNRTYARQVKTVLGHVAPTVEVDTASNVFEVRRRFRTKGPYDLILADISFSADSSELSSALDSVSTPKLLWSVVDSLAKPASSFRHWMCKPTDPDVLQEVLSKEVLSRVTEQQGA